jgi:HPt (histidine-containing phosphotransfer) domain-containing protein
MKMFRQYKDQLQKRVEEIRSALQDGDVNRLARLAHNLGGVSLNFGAAPLANITSQLEETCDREDLNEATILVSQLETEAHQLEDYLSKNGF